MQIKKGQTGDLLKLGNACWGPAAGLYVEFGSIIQLKYLMNIKKNNMTLDRRTKISGETIKQTFWQISINNKRPKLKV